jgi:hypothetical protein
MIAINWLQFFLNFIISGFVIRMLQIYTAGTDLGRALAFVS